MLLYVLFPDGWTRTPTDVVLSVVAAGLLLFGWMSAETWRTSTLAVGMGVMLWPFLGNSWMPHCATAAGMVVALLIMIWSLSVKVGTAVGLARPRTPGQMTAPERKSPSKGRHADNALSVWNTTAMA
jgi:hypothetical protein